MNALAKILNNAFIGFVLWLSAVILNPVNASVKTSTATGDWNVNSTWVGNIAPVAGDYVVIENGHTVTITATPAKILGITIQAGGVLNSGTYTLWITNTITGGWPEYISYGIHNSSSGGKIYYDASSANLNFSGSGTINCDIEYDNAAYNAQFVSCSLTINGNINFLNGGFVLGDGSLTLIGDINSNTGASSFNVYQNATGAVINQTGNLNYNSGGNWTRNDGTWNLSGNINMASPETYFTDYGTATIEGNVLGSGISQSYFDCSGYTTFKGSVFPAGSDGSLSAAYGFTTTVEYNGGGNQDIKLPVSGVFGAIPDTYSNLILSNTGTKTMTSNLIINDGLSILNTAILDVSATPYNIDLKGAWINTGTAADPFVERSATMTLSGTTAQTITASPVSGGETFYNLVINNTSTGVTLLNPATVSNALTLTDGTVFTDATNLLILNDNATSNAGSAASFVDGPMKKIGDEAFVFPSGDGGVWARIGISAPSTATTAYTAQYFNAVYGDGDLAGDLYTTSPHHVSSLEYSILAQAVNNDDIRITLFWENASVSKITDCPELSIGHFTGAAWEEEAATTDPGSTCSGTGSGSITTNAIVGAYSPFTFASKYGWANNPLPIELLNFTGELNAEGQVVLNWTTSTETNNHYFTVERISSPPFGTGGEIPSGEKISKITSIPIGTLPGAGNSGTPLSYQLLDKSPRSSPAADGKEPGMRYYRLKQTDYDGKSTYSQIISVTPRYPLSTVIYPNPATDNAILYLSAETEELLLLTIVDKIGRIVIKQEEKLSEGPNYFTLDVAALNQGAYIMQLKTASGTIEQIRLMIVR